MKKENKKIEPRFIPCGDSLEKMNVEMNEEALESVSGGDQKLLNQAVVGYFKKCPACGHEDYAPFGKLKCKRCGYHEE